MKIKTNLIFALVVALIGVIMGWIFNETYANSMIGAGIFAGLSFIVLCIDDKWGPAIEKVVLAEDVQET